MTDLDLRSAVHGALYRAAVRSGADEVAAIQTADAECAALDATFGGQRHYWHARDNEARRRAIAEDLARGHSPVAVAVKHGVSVKTVQRAKQRAGQSDDPGLGRDDWVIK